jgi:hypothetical protein
MRGNIRHLRAGRHYLPTSANLYDVNNVHHYTHNYSDKTSRLLHQNGAQTEHERLIYQTLFYIEIISFKIEIHITIPGLHSEQDVDPVLLAQDPGEHF